MEGLRGRLGEAEGEGERRGVEVAELKKRLEEAGRTEEGLRGQLQEAMVEAAQKNEQVGCFFIHIFL